MSDHNRVDDSMLCEQYATTSHDSQEWVFLDPQPESHGWFSDPYEGSHRKADAVLVAWFLATVGAGLMGWSPVVVVLGVALVLTLLVGGVAVLVGITSRL